MLPAIFDVTQVDVENGRCVLRASRQGAQEPRLPRRLPGGRSDKLENADGGGAGDASRRSPRASCLKLLELETGAEVHPAAGAVQRGHAGQGARGERYRPAFDLRRDPLDALRARVRREASKGASGRRRSAQVVNRLLQSGFNDILNEGYTARLEVRARRDRGGRSSPGRTRSSSSTRSSTRTWRAATEVARHQGPRNRDRRALSGRADERCPKCGTRAGRPLRPLRRLRRVQRLPRRAVLRLHAQRPRDRRPTTRRRPTKRAEIAPCELCGKPMAAAPLALRHLPRLHRLSRVQEHPQDRSAGDAPEADRRRLPRVQGRNDRGEDVAPRQDVLLLQPLSEVQVRALEQADRDPLPELRQPAPDREDHQEEGHGLALPQGGVRLRSRGAGVGRRLNRRLRDDLAVDRLEPRRDDVGAEACANDLRGPDRLVPPEFRTIQQVGRGRR